MSRRRYPNQNRIYGGGALSTHSVWQDSIGYDPHAPIQRPHSGSPCSSSTGPAAADLASGYDQFRALLARATASKGGGGTGSLATCTKCRGSGHLAFNCWNVVAAPARLPNDPACTPGRRPGSALLAVQRRADPANTQPAIAGQARGCESEMRKRKRGSEKSSRETKKKTKTETKTKTDTEKRRKKRRSGGKHRG